MRYVRIAAVLCAIALPFSGAALAQDYPTKPIRVIVPFPPGGGTDMIARLIIEKVRQNTGAKFIIDNRPGAGATLGTDAIAKSAPDGYTIGVVSASHAINASLYPTLPYKTVEDFAPVTFVASAPGVVVVNPDLPIKNIADLTAYLKANAGKVTYASAGIGTPPHLAGEMYKTMTGTEMDHVPYDGNSDAWSDLISGRVQVSFPSIPSALPYIQSGQLRAIAATSADRATALPDVPTIAESGLAGYDASNWWAVLAPAGTPPAILTKLQKDIDHALEDPEVQKQYANSGYEAVHITPEKAAEMMKSEVAKWSDAVKASGAKVE